MLEFSMSFKTYISLNELSLDDKVLLEKAKEASNKAYAIYSNYYVGAAVRLENGEILVANNQENAAYPSGICAERALLFYKNANFPEIKIVALAIFAFDKTKNSDSSSGPCGACRQVMLEYENLQKTVYKVIFQTSPNQIVISDSASNLLPYSFSLSR
jgi:cytidine deaminase